ncbi:MAG: hypothetical protein JW941_04660 [Candidatus Coatesbacteria bacterium]|nr:hypothetical protein [Candidatus Coatesbacteria bacterium]
MKKRTTSRTSAKKQEITESNALLESEQALEYRINLVVLVIIVILLLTVVIVPGSWLNTASMWCRAHIPGL